jgi:hypothetical protein
VLADISVDSAAWQAGASAVLAERIVRTSAVLRLPLVLRLTGTEPLPAEDAARVARCIAAYRLPVFATLSGNCASSHLDLLAADLVLASPDLALASDRRTPYSAAEARQAGIVDVVVGEMDIEIAARLGERTRVSVSRRIANRRQTMDRRGAESSAAAEAARSELIKLQQVRENLVRSVDQWRDRIERRDFHIPAL